MIPFIEDRKIRKELRIWDVCISIRKVSISDYLWEGCPENIGIFKEDAGILYKSFTPQEIKHCYFFECSFEELDKITITNLFDFFQKQGKYSPIVEELLGVGHFSFMGKKYYVKRSEFGFVFGGETYNIIKGE